MPPPSSLSSSFLTFDQPPQGLEEGRRLAIRKLCLCLAGAKPKAFFRSCDRDGAQGSGGGGGGGDGGGGGGEGGGADLMGALQEALVRSLCGSRPEAQVGVCLRLFRRSCRRRRRLRGGGSVYPYFIVVVVFETFR